MSDFHDNDEATLFKWQRLAQDQSYRFRPPTRVAIRSVYLNVIAMADTDLVLSFGVWSFGSRNCSSSRRSTGIVASPELRDAEGCRLCQRAVVHLPIFCHSSCSSDLISTLGSCRILAPFSSVASLTWSVAMRENATAGRHSAFSENVAQTVIFTACGRPVNECRDWRPR